MGLHIGIRENPPKLLKELVFEKKKYYNNCKNNKRGKIKKKKEWHFKMWYFMSIKLFIMI